MRTYKICTKCVMDTSDSRITFDSNGICDHCNNFSLNVMKDWEEGDGKRGELEIIVENIKRKGKNKKFDCILGLSGGVDSTYMLHTMVKDFNLKPLVFHVDGGWNSELAVHNINVIIEKLNLDLFTEVINWEEMKDFQLAFFKSGLPHIDIPQDHAFIATLYNFAQKYDIKYILNGGNISTECVQNPMEYLYYGTDMVHIKDIIKRFGTMKMKSYPFSSIFRHKIYLRYVKNLKVIKPLNYIKFIKKDAIQILIDEYDWKPYPQKHFESRFTAFFEGYWLPERFGFDTRRVQFSSLILTGQMERDEAIEKLKKTAYDIEKIDNEFKYVAKKLDISVEILKHYFQMEKKFYWDYKNQSKIFDFGAKVLKYFGTVKAVKR